MYCRNDEWTDPRLAYKDANLVSELLCYATERSGHIPDWLAAKELLDFAKVCKDHMPEWFTLKCCQESIRLSDAIVRCRKACRDGEVIAAELLGLAAELSPTLLGCLDDSLAASIPDLLFMSTLSTRSSDARIAAISAISKFGKHTPLDAVEAIVGRFTDTEECPQVQREALRAIPTFGIDKAAIAVPALINSIKNCAYPAVSIAACRVLEFIGVQARSAVETLVRAAVSDDGAEVNAAAALALTKIDPGGELVLEHAKRADTHIRLNRILLELGEQGRKLRQHLEFCLVDVVQRFETQIQIADACEISMKTLQRRWKGLGIEKTDGFYYLTREQLAALGGSPTKSR